MSRKIIPTTQSDSDMESFESMESQKNQIKKKIHQFFDWDGDGKIEIDDMKVNCEICMNFISYIYDVSVDNLPMGSFIGMFITISGISLILNGVTASSDILLKYNEDLYLFKQYYYTSVISFLLLHTAVLLYGISIFILETRREACQIEEVGCYCCCKKKSKLRSICKCFQSCAQKSVQTAWGVIGTSLMFIFYFLIIGFFIVSLSSTSVSFFLNNSCDGFSNMIVRYKNVSLDYIQDAKMHVNSADSTALMIIGKYNKCMNMKTQYIDHGFGRIYEKDQFTFMEGPERRQKFVPDEPNLNYNPMEKLAEGREVLAVLNETIYQTELQINYYDEQLTIFKKICYDYASIYDNLYMITIGSGLILISHFVMFAVHYKYFSVWNYEVRLVELNGYYITDKK